MRKLALGIATVAMAFTVIGCGGSKNSSTIDDFEAQLADKEREVSELQTSLDQTEKSLADTKLEADQAMQRAREAEAAAAAAASSGQASATSTSTAMPSGDDLLPPAAPGECYARVFVPATYQTQTSEMLRRESYDEISIVPAKFEWVEEKVMVKPESRVLQEVPAEYENVTEEVLVEAAHKVWKKGRGPIEKIDEGTGEIMCLVEVPAKYRTVTKRVLKSEASTKEVVIPAEYETVRVRKMVAEPQVERSNVPAEYQTVSKREMVEEGRMEWRPILCETNLNRDLVKRLQVALRDAGHDAGPIDGIIGRQTRAGVRSFQKAKGLAVGELTYETVEALGVQLGS